MRRFADAVNWTPCRMRPSILNFRRPLETDVLAAQMLESVNAHLARKAKILRARTTVDATIINARRSTKTGEKKRGPQMRQTGKDNPRYFGMKAHIGVDEFSGLVQHAICTAANVGDVTMK